ncbi:MAG: PP2C family protein-serine/threonine phosphatase [Iamia sp.]
MNVGVPSEVHAPSRLRAVAGTGLAGSHGEAAFDDLTAAAAGLLETPLAFFTVLDEQRCWYAGASGLPEGGDRSGTIDASFCKYVVATDAPLLVSDARTDARTAGNPAIAEMGVVAWAGFPVRDPAGEVLGSFCVVDVRPREWSVAQIEALRVLAQAATDQVHLRQSLQSERRARAEAEQAWIAAEVARDEAQRAWIDAEVAQVELQKARAREHEVIDVMQRSLLPRLLPEVPGLLTAVRFDASNDAADIGGDWYDMIRQGADETSFIVGDVCGHDVGAVAVMAQVRHSLHLLALRQAHPIDALAELDGLMLEHDFDRFATVAIVSWDASTAGLTYASAGHPPPLLIRSDGATTYLEEGRRPPVNIGLVGTVPTIPGEVTLGSGDTVVIFTDGLYESTGTDLEDGLGRLARIAGEVAPRAEPDEVCDALLWGMRPDQGWTDDVALVVLRRP